MFTKSYAKINLSLFVNKKLSNGLHDIETIFCQIDLFDKISIKKIKNKSSDKIYITGPYSKNVNPSNNSILKTLNILRKYNLISNFYSVKIYKKIPVFSGLGGGTSNAASIIKFLVKKKIKTEIFNKIVQNIGSDLRLFFHKQGFLKNLKTVVGFKKKYKLFFLLIKPNFFCSTKEIYSKVKNNSKKNKFSNNFFYSKSEFINQIINLNNDLQSIVENKYPIIKKLISETDNLRGCYFSRMSGSGSACYGLFINEQSSKAALKNLRKKYPKFSFSIAKTI